MNIANEVGRLVYQRIGLPPSAPPEEGAVSIAIELYGDSVIYPAPPRSLFEATGVSIGGRTRIALRQGTPVRRANYAIAHAIAVMLLQQLGESAMHAPELAAFLVAPTDAYQTSIDAVGLDLVALGNAYTITGTSAALRFAEVANVDAAVTTPDRVHVHGPGLKWMSHDDVRAIARRKNPKSVRRRVIHDEVGRVALIARAS